MRHSEFWQCVDEVYGSAYGRSLALDLALPNLGNVTATQALQAGIKPQEVWRELVLESGIDPREVWHYQEKPAKKRPGE